MINQNPDNSRHGEISDDVLNQGLQQIRAGSLRLASENNEPMDPSLAKNGFSSHEPTPDEVWEYMAANRNREFDHTTEQGRRMFELFEIANKERNHFTFEAVKNMVNVIAKVPADIVKTVVSNPLKAPISAVDAVARDVRDLFGVLAESEDPASPLFRFRSYLSGNGSVEERIKQFNEARWFNNKSQELEEGKGTVIEDFFPEDKKEFIRSLVDPKMAQALSYIGLDLPHVLMSPLRARRALSTAVHAYKSPEAFGAALNESASAMREGLDLAAKRGKNLAGRAIGGTMSGVADVVATPFRAIEEKIRAGSSAIAETSGANVNVLKNAASTVLSDSGEKIVGGMGMSPIRSTLFSFGVKPLAEYASVLGSEIIDAAQGVTAVRPEHMGKGMLERLASKNGSRIPMSTEAMAVAKFTNIVVGWPASMAIPVLKRAVGDAAVMGTLGYLNARGEGAASGAGVGFAWGGISGSLRHVHNVYQHSQSQKYMIDNFDNAQINQIASVAPENARNYAEINTVIDRLHDDRVSATARAFMSMLHTTDATTQFRFADVNELYSEFAVNGVIPEFNGMSMEQVSNQLGSELRIQKDGKVHKVIWVNKFRAVPETIGHEIAHRVLNHVLSSDGDSFALVQQFLGDSKDAGVLSDSAIAYLVADYTATQYGLDKKAQIPILAKRYEAELASMREKIANKTISWSQMSKNAHGELVPEPMNEPSSFGGGHLSFSQILHEVFAYNASNQLLTKGSDFFLRNPESTSLRAHFENLYTMMNQRTVAKAEEAGLIIQHVMSNAENTPNNVAFQTFMWEDGQYRRFEMLDKWSENIMRKAMRNGDINASLMSPERAKAYFEATGKIRFSNVINAGRVMKDKKEIDQLITENAEQMVKIWEGLPDDVRPKFTKDQGGNVTVDLTNVSKEAWDAVTGNINMTKAEIDDLRGICEVIRDNRSGKPVFNTFTGQYLGRTHQVELKGLVKRLTGKDVPVTYRRFSPFAAELKFDKFDENGNPIKNPKGHVTLHVVDVAVLDRRRQKMWSRADVRGIFTDFGHFTRTFTAYMHNLSQATGIKMPSEKLFEKEFGSQAGKVRDLMYETFGGRKRVDESYINVPSDGYAGNKDGPNYPFHSLRFELLANLERQTRVFAETFGIGLGNLPYNHIEAYEGVRRNLMVGGFRPHELDNDRKFWSNGAGYEVRGDSGRFRLFTPYGNSVGVFKTPEKAFASADKHAKKLDPTDFTPTSGNDGVTPDENLDILPTIAGALNGSANFMTSGGKIVHLDIQDKMNRKLANFKNLASRFDFTNPLTKRNVTLPALTATMLERLGAPYITLRDLCGTSAKTEGHVLKKYPELGNLLIYCSGGSFVNGDVDVQLGSGRQAFDAIGISEWLAKHKNFEDVIQSELMPHIQSWIDLKEGVITARQFAFCFTGKLLESELVGIQVVGKFQTAFNTYKNSGNPNATVNDFLKSQAETFTTDFVDDYINGRLRKGSTISAPSFINGNDFVQPLWGSNPSQTEPPTIAAKPGKNTGKKNWKKTDANGKLLYELTPTQVQQVNDHFLKIYRSFVGNNPSSYCLNIMGRFMWFVDGNLINNPVIQQIRADLNAKYPKGGEHFIANISKSLQDTHGLLHAMSKKPDRKIQMGGTLDMDANESNRYGRNIGLVENPTPRTEPEFTYLDDDGNAVSGAFDGEPRVNFQTSLIAEGLGNYVMLHIGLGHGPGFTSTSELVVQHNRFIPIQVKWNDQAKGFVSPTSDMKGLKASVQELLGSFPNQGGEQIMSVNMSMAMLRQSPFLEYEYSTKTFQATGSLHEAYKSGIHVDMLQQVAKEVMPNLSEQDMAQLATASGAERFVRLTYDLKQDAKVYHARQIGMAVQQILLGDEIINGDPKRIAQAAGAFGYEARQSYIERQLSDPNVLGRVMVNAGYAKLMKTAVLADTNVMKRSFEQSRRTKPLAKMMGEVKRFSNNTFDVMGVNIHEKRPRYIGGFGQKPPQLGASYMVGGYQNSTNARMKEMVDLGMARQIRTDAGKIYHAFEFTDADSQLKLESVRGELHLLPFLGGYGLDDTATEGLDKVSNRFFDEYLKARASNDKAAMDQIVARLSYVKLSDLLDHKLLYNFYPNLKNVMVGFKTGYDASYAPNLNKITIGIDRLIGDEVNKRIEANKIPTSIFEGGPDRGARALLLHEIQHSIQKVEGWTDAYSVNNLEDFNVGAIRFLVGEIMGNKEAVGVSRDVLSNKDIDYLEKYFGPDAKIGTRTPLDVLNAVRRLIDSPMHKQIRAFALPAVIRVVGQMALAVSDAYGEMSESHPERKRAEAVVRDLENIHRKVNQYNQMIKDGTASPNDVYVALTKRGGIIEAIGDMQNRSYSLGDSPIAKALFNDMSYANRYLTESLSLLQQNESLKALTVGDTNGQMLALRQIADTLSDMQYHGMRSEIEANLTERRSKMSQAELNKSGLSPSGERISGIEGFEGPLDVGVGGNSLRKLGLAIAEKKSVRSLMFGQSPNLMVGGLGLGMSAFDTTRQEGMTDNLRVLETLGRLATVSHAIRAINDDLSALKLYGFTSRGWEVDAETGKISLVYKKGIMKGFKDFDAVDADELNLRDRMRRGRDAGTGTMSIASGNDEFVIVNALDKENKGTLNIEQLASLLDAKIELMESIETPVEAVNIIMDDPDFPPVILADNIVSYLAGRGVSADGISLSNAESIAKVFVGQNLTKAELVNIMSFFHQQLVDEITYGSKESFIAKATEKAMSVVNRESGLTMTEALSVLESGFAGDVDNTATTILSGHENNTGDFYHVVSKDEDSKQLGLFKARRGVLRFELRKPTFISQADWDGWVNERLGRTKYLKKEKGGNYYITGESLSSSEIRTHQNSTADLHAAAKQLNRRLARKLVLLKPFIEGMTSYLKSSEFSSLSPNSRRIALFSLLDEMYKDSIKVNPYSESDKHQSRSEIKRMQSDRDDFGSSGFSESVSRLLYPDEVTIPDSIIKHGKPLPRFGTETLSRSVIGTSADPNSILFNTRSILSPIVGLTADRNIGFRSYRDVVPEVLKANLGQVIHKVFYYNDEFFGQVYGVPHDLSQFYLNHVVASSYLYAWGNYLTSEAQTYNLEEMPMDNRAEIIKKVYSLSALAGELEMRHMLSLQNISPRALPITINPERRSKLFRDTRNETSWQGQQVYKDAMALDASVVSATNGYVSKAGEVVITDSRLAQSLAANQVGKIESIPVPVKGKGTPMEMIHNAERVGAMIHFEDMKLRDYLFGTVYGESRVLRSGTSVVSKLLEIRNTLSSRPEATPKTLPQKRDKSAMMWNGLHALHSSLYFSAVTNGIDKSALTRAVSNTPLLIDILQNHNKYALPFDAHTVNAALAPLVLMAMAEKQAYIYQGKVVEGDFLLPEQRAAFNAIVSGEPTPTLPAFWATLEGWQKHHILGYFNNNNVVHTFDNLVGAMSAKSIIERLKTAEAGSLTAMDALYANAGGFVKAMENALDTYLSHDAFWWETGVQGGAPFLDTSEGNYGINRIHDNVTMFFARAGGGLEHVTNQELAEYVRSLNSVPAFDHVETATAGGLTIPYTEATGDEIRGSGRRFVFGQNVQTDKGLQFVKASGFFGSGTPFVNLGEQVNAGNEIIFPRQGGISSARSILDNKNNYESFVTRSPQFKLVPSDKGGIAAQILAGRQELTKSGVSTILSDQPSTGVNLKEHKFSKRGVGLTSAFMRKQMVDGIIREARRANKESAVIEPARYKLSGRIKPTLHIMAAESDSTKAQYLSELAIYGATSISPTPYTIVHGSQDADSNKLPLISAPFGHKPSYGFAFKKLSDGSTVVNVTGDHFSHKYMLKASRKGIYQKKSYFGFNIQEGLGYNPNNGLMTPSAFEGVSMGFKKEVEGIPDAVLAYAQFGGPAWVDEIIKGADHTLANGISETRVENNVIAGTGDVVVQGVHKQALLDGTFAGSEDKLLPAYEMVRHGISHNYMTFTFPPNTPPEVIKGTLMLLFASNSSVELARWNASAFGGYTLSYYGRGLIGSGIGKAQIDYIKSGNLRSLTPEGSAMNAQSINTLFKETLNLSTKKATSSSLPIQDIWAPFNLMNQSELNGHLDTLMGMIVGKDHGYFLPQSEKQLIVSGDTKVAIEAMFPNRPDLLEYAWDNEKTGDVIIVEQKDKKKKVTGYLIGYNIQTGYDEAGNKTYARRVVPARTRAEAEAIKLKFTVSTSKAELAMAIERISNNGKQAIKLNTLDAGNVVFEAMTNRVASLGSDGVLTYKKTDTQTVGHTDKPMSAQMAEAIANTLAQNQGLSVDIGQPTANLMVGSRNSMDLEASLRRRIQFGSGLGPIEFSSRLMNAIAYGKLKNKPEHMAYPATLTGAEWFKFLKESKVSKDEFRQTGLITLLHANKDQQISRQELAEFVHTTYPSTYRISRHTNPIVQESDASSFRLPWGEDIATKENQVLKDLSTNLIVIGDAIDSAIKPDTTPEAIAEIEMLKKSMMTALDTLIKEANLPASIKERATMAGVFESLKEEIEKQVSSDNQDSVVKFGSQRTIRPMQLNYLYKTFIESRMESLNTMALDYFGGHDGLQIQDPYSYLKMDTFMMDPDANKKLFGFSVAENYNPMGPYTRNTWDLGLMMKVNQGNHNSYATAYGQYTSSVMQSEIMGAKTQLMFDSYRAELEDRLTKTNNPEDIRRIRSIQASLDRVREARTAINRNYNFNDASHYSGNPNSTFQLGHLRETITIKNAELGLFTFGDKKFVGGDKLNDPVSGVQGKPEPVIVIEEIQSDTFQRYEVSAAGKQEMALPDSFEQVEGILRAGDLAKVSQQIEKLENLLQNNESCVKTQINNLSTNDGFATKFDAIFLRTLAKSLLNPFEIYSLFRAYYEAVKENHHNETTSVQFNEVFVNTGRTVKPSGNYAHMAETTPEIPVYEIDFDALDRISKSLDTNLYDKNPHLYKVMNLIGAEAAVILAKTIYANSPSVLHGVNRSPLPYAQIAGCIVPIVGMIDEVAASMGKMADTINDSVAPDLIDYDMVGGKVIQWVKDRIKFLESGNAVDGDGVLPSRIQHKALTALAQTLEQMSRENPNNFRIPAMDIAGDSIIAKNGEISIGDVYSKNNGGTSMIETITYERALYDESGSYVAGRVSEGNRYQVMKTNARSALGVAVAHAVRPWAVRGSIDAIPTQLKELKAKQAELAKLVPINPSKEGSTIINTSMPFGVEDIYKPVSLNATIIRAAARGMDSIILSDARHMFNRGYSPNESFRTPYLILGRRRRLFQVPDVMKPLAATIAHMSMFENSFGLYGNLIGRLKEMPDVELEPIMSGYKFTHEGNDLTLYHHFGKLTEQFLGFVYANGTPEYNTPFTLDSVYSQNTESVSPMAFRRDSSDTLGNAMVDENGKPLNPAKVDENSLLGRLFAREKRRVQQAFKSMGSFALLTENGDCMGYVSNYGLPSYWLEGHFAGAERSLIDFYATDAFDVPVLEYQADTGTYNIVDAKTGKLIRATKNKAEALEVFHQSKKYRGGNGYIGNFLKNWSGLGGYVGTAFYSGASSANGLGELHNSNAGFAPIESILRTPVIPKEIAIPRSDVTFDLPNDRARTLVHDQRQSRPDKPLWANNPANNKFRKLQYIARGLMTNKQVTQFETMIASASGTMMRFKPRFPTEEHKTAWRKRAIEGIANLMPSGTPDYRPNPTAGNLDLLRRISELRRAPIENPDDESQTSR